MHQSRLMSVLIDCAEADFERGVAFWSHALGKETIREATATSRCAGASAATAGRS